MRNLSWPAVSHTVSLIRLLLSSRCLTLKSTPMVDWMCSSNASSVKRMSMDDCNVNRIQCGGREMREVGTIQP